MANSGVSFWYANKKNTILEVCNKISTKLLLSPNIGQIVNQIFNFLYNTVEMHISKISLWPSYRQINLIRVSPSHRGENIRAVVIYQVTIFFLFQFNLMILN